ncbi:MAG TPA: ABC transporter permease [Gemmatimonadaceae bacterium]
MSVNFLELFATVRRRLRYLAGKAAAERDMHDEMRAHLEFEIADRIRNGMSPEEAGRTALVDFGGVERFKEEGRAARGTRLIEDLGQDIHYAARVLRQSPAFTVAGVLTVAIGIAAMTAVFSVVDALLFRPPPIAAPSKVFMVGEVWKDGERSWETSMGLYMYPYEHYLAHRSADSAVFSGLAGFRYTGVSMLAGNEARALSAMMVSANYFQVLGVHSALGRLFSDTTERVGAELPEVVISYGMWQREFGGDSTAIGKLMTVDGHSRVIVGIAPSGFNGTEIGLVTDLWAPVNDGTFAMVGRLRPQFTRDRAAIALSAIGAHIDPVSRKQPIARITLDPIVGPPAMARGAVIGFVGVLFITAALVLLIVVANIAGMFSARAAHRRREIAVRLALGAGRGRLVRQLLTESVGLCLIGGAGGVLLATWLTHLLPAINLPMSARTSLELHSNRVVLGVSFISTLLAGIAVGIAPALQSTRMDLLAGLRGTDSSQPRGIGRSRSTFVIAQLALSLVLLITAGLFTRAVQRAVLVDRGLDTRNVIVATMNVARHGYDDARAREFYAQLMPRLTARPEIAAASRGEFTPLSISHSGGNVPLPDGSHVQTLWALVDTGYLATMRIPMLAGRAFSGSDTPLSTPVAIINETLAKRLGFDRAAIGHQIKLDREFPREIVGIVRDGKYRSLDEAPTAFAFIPVSQSHSDLMTVHVRARTDMPSALAALRAEVAALDRNIALENVGSLSSQLDLYVLPQRAAAWCIGLFGILGLGLAALGIYGVVAYDVAQRTRELGIRLALGATSRDIVQVVVRSSVVAIGVALLIGLPLALATGRLASQFLFGVGMADPLTFAVVPALLGSVALIASYLPARRAARTDPMVSLRTD